MKQLKVIFLFQRKLLVPAMVMSALVGAIAASIPGNNFIKSVLIANFFMLPLIHYVTYELFYPREYYFYYNFGVSKQVLWCSTVAVGILGVIISAFL